MCHAPLLPDFFLGEGHDPSSCRLTARDKPCLACQMVSRRRRKEEQLLEEGDNQGLTAVMHHVVSLGLSVIASSVLSLSVHSVSSMQHVHSSSHHCQLIAPIHATLYWLAQELQS